MSTSTQPKNRRPRVAGRLSQPSADQQSALERGLVSVWSPFRPGSRFRGARRQDDSPQMA